MPESGSDQVRTRVLARAATALADSTDVDGVAQALVLALCPALADGCEVALRGQDGTIWRIASGPGEMSARLRTPVPDFPEHPLRRAVNGEFLVIDAEDDPQQTLFGPASVATSARALGLRSAIVAPMMSGSGPDAAITGAVAAAMGHSGRSFSPEDQALMRTIAQLAGRTIDNLQSADMQRRVAARLRTAAEAGTLFAQAQEAEAIAEILIRRGGDELGAHSGLGYVVDDGRVRLVAYYGHAAERVERWRDLPIEPGTPLGDLVTGRLPSLFLEGMEAMLSRYPAIGSVEGAAHRSLVGTRLCYGDQIVGAAFWTFDVERRFNDADRGYIELIAEQAAAAMVRAQATAAAARSLQQLLQVEQRQRQIARTLQESLLPRTLPAIDGFQLHVEYWPARGDMDVGGDFYDVFPIDERRWALAIGDVCGKGAAAAAVTGTARHSLRAAALHIRDETRVLRWVHDAIAAQDDAPYCTLVYAVLDPGDTAILRVVLAGHERGVRVRPSGEIDEVGEYGTLLGVFPPVVHVHSIAIEAGDVVLFHTDGITDAPGTEALSRDELVTIVANGRHKPLAEIGGLIRDELDRRRPDGDRDDTALLLLRHT